MDSFTYFEIMSEQHSLRGRKTIARILRCLADLIDEGAFTRGLGGSIIPLRFHVDTQRDEGIIVIGWTWKKNQDGRKLFCAINNIKQDKSTMPWIRWDKNRAKNIADVTEVNNSID